MKNLNLYKVWQICNRLSNKEQELSEHDIYVYLMGGQSEYSESSFEKFLSYYSFRFENDNVVVFNDDAVAYENYNNSDFSYIPTHLLVADKKELEEYIETEITKQLKGQEEEELAQKENIRQQIERLTKQLNKYD